MKKIDRLWAMINQEKDEPILKYHPNKESLVEYLRFSRTESTVTELFWGLRGQCLRALELEAIQKK